MDLDDEKPDAPDEKPDHVQIGQREFQLELPPSHTQRVEIADAMRSSWLRAYGAALGACIPSLPRRLKVSWESCGNDVLVFGQRIVDGLAEAKVEHEQIVRAGLKAWQFVSAGVLRQPEVKATEDFFGRSEGPSS
jgi:hypothetical protein